MIALVACLHGLSPKTRMYRSTNSQDRCTLVPRLFTLVTHILQLLFKFGSSFQKQLLLFYFRRLLYFCIFAFFPTYKFWNIPFFGAFSSHIFQLIILLMLNFSFLFIHLESPAVMRLISF